MIRQTLIAAAVLLSACSGGGATTPDATPAPTPLPPTVHDLDYPNPDEVPDTVEVIRFAVEWRIVAPGKPVPCNGYAWVGGCTTWVPGTQICTVLTNDPLDYTGNDHEIKLAALGHEIAAHCARAMSDQEWADEQRRRQ